MKIKTAELTDAALDWAVAKAMGHNMPIGTFGPLFGKGVRWPMYQSRRYTPSADWFYGGPIIEREMITTSPSYTSDSWMAFYNEKLHGTNVYVVQPLMETKLYGPTPLIAAMRCFVASRLGDEVEVPDELL